jgi:nicotinamidase-related amidase
MRIGDPGPNGRILIRGEKGQDIIPELYPIDGEPVVDKPGKGAFYATMFGQILAEHGIQKLVVAGVTTEVCVHTTVREANDRGYECLVLSDCVGSYFPEFQRVGLNMVSAQGGIFGWVAPAEAFLSGLVALTPAPAAVVPAP